MSHTACFSAVVPSQQCRVYLCLSIPQQLSSLITVCQSVYEKQFALHVCGVDWIRPAGSGSDRMEARWKGRATVAVEARGAPRPAEQGLAGEGTLRAVVTRRGCCETWRTTASTETFTTRKFAADRTTNQRESASTWRICVIHFEKKSRVLWKMVIQYSTTLTSTNSYNVRLQRFSKWVFV